MKAVADAVRDGTQPKASCLAMAGQSAVPAARRPNIQHRDCAVRAPIDRKRRNGPRSHEVEGDLEIAPETDAAGARSAATRRMLLH